MKIAYRGVLIYRLLAPQAIPFDQLEERLAALPADDPAVSQMSRSGFVPAIAGTDELLTDLSGGRYALSLETATRVVPNKIVAREVGSECKRWLRSYHRDPSREEKQSIKSRIITEMMEVALIDYTRLNAIISGPFIYIETTSAKKAELFLGCLRRVLGSLHVQPLTMKHPVSPVFTSWVAGKSEPEQLSVGDAFSATGKLEGTRVLSGKKVDLGQTTLSDILGKDYTITALELNYYDDHLHGTVTFMLNDGLAMRSITWPSALTDMATEAAGVADDEEESIVIARTTMLLLADALDSLIDGITVSLGGEARLEVDDEKLADIIRAVKNWKISAITGEDDQEESEEDLPDDPLAEEAAEFVRDTGRVSISGIQRKYRIGYNRASRIVEQLEANGVISEPGLNGTREVIGFQLGDTDLKTDFGLVGDDDDDGVI